MGDMANEFSLRAFREALVPGDPRAVVELIEGDPSLVHARPWEPDWSGAALDMVAGLCVFHRPRAREIATLLVERGADCNLQTAARCGMLQRVRAMLEADGALLDEQDDEGRTALYRATCVYGKFEEGEAVADFLLEGGAALDLFSAGTLGLLERVEQLLAASPFAAASLDPERG